MNVLLAHHYFLSVCDLEHLHVVVMRNDQQCGAVALEADVIDPSAQVINREQHFIHGVNILKRSVVLIIFNLGFNDERIFGVAEAAGDDLDREISRSDS